MLLAVCLALLIPVWGAGGRESEKPQRSDPRSAFQRSQPHPSGGHSDGVPQRQASAQLSGSQQDLFRRLAQALQSGGSGNGNLESQFANFIASGSVDGPPPPRPVHSGGGQHQQFGTQRGQSFGGPQSSQQQGGFYPQQQSRGGGFQQQQPPQSRYPQSGRQQGQQGFYPQPQQPQQRGGGFSSQQRGGGFSQQQQYNNRSSGGQQFRPQRRAQQFDGGFGRSQSSSSSSQSSFDSSPSAEIGRYTQRHPGKMAMMDVWGEAVRRKFLPRGELDVDRTSRFIAAFKNTVRVRPFPSLL